MMKQIKHRRLMLFSLTFVIFIYISLSISQASVKNVIIALSILLILVSGVGCIGRKGKLKNVLIALPILLGALLGSLRGSGYYSDNIISSAKLNEMSGRAVGVVTEVIYESEFSTSYTIKLLSFDGNTKRIDTVVTFPFAYNADVNDLLSFTAEFYFPSTEAMGFNEKEYYSSQGIFILCNGEADVKTIGRDRSVPAYFRGLSDDLSAKLRVSLGEYNGGFIACILLGRRGQVPSRLNTSFRYLGISHILSVSGLHLAILISALFFILTRLLPFRPTTIVVCSIFAVSFVMLVGAPPSAVRSCVMVILSLFAQLYGKQYDALTALCFSAFIILLIDPASADNVGFILSVSATLGIIVLGAPCCSQIMRLTNGRNVLIRTLGSVGMSICVTLSATLFTLPAVIYYFGEVSVVSVLANLLFVPLCSVLLYLSVIFLLLYATPLSNVVSIPVTALAKLIDRLSYSLSQKLPEPSVLIPKLALISIILAAITFSVIMLIKRKHRLLCLVSVTLIFTISYVSGSGIYNSRHGSDTLALCVNNGKNDYLLLSKGGNTLLCDFSSGSSSGISAAADIGVSALLDSSPDTLLLTHLHRKHITAVSKLSDSIRLRQIFIPVPQSDDEAVFASAIERIAAESSIKLYHYDPNVDTVFDFEGCKITLYRQIYIKRSTQPVHLLTVEDNRTLVYCGSALTETELSGVLPNSLSGDTYLWLGIHGPLIKESLTLPFSVNHTFASNNDVNDAYGTSYSVINGYCVVRLK